MSVYEGHGVTLHHGDCLDVLRSLPDCSVDSVVTDPPYNLAFMGKAWDDHASAVGFQQWCELWAAECLRVLRPGGHLLAFGGTRTWHRLACAVEDAGFEVRDSIAWLYGSGFSKGGLLGNKAGLEWCECGPNPLDDGARRGRVGCPRCGGLDPALRGFSTTLKPAFEPVVVARKPLASPDVNVLDRVEWELRNTLGEKEIRWTTRRASGAAKSGPSTSSSTTPPPSMAAISAAPADASATANVEPQTASSSAQNSGPGARRTASTSAPTAASNSASSETPSSKPMAASVSAATSGSSSSSPSTTSTAEEPDTVRKSDDTSTPNSDERATPTGTASSVGTATGLTGSRARVLIERLPDGSFIWPEGLPRFVKGGPLTVAANVLAWGTGALNIDGCRIAVDPDDPVNTAVWTSRPSTIRPGTQGFITSHADGERSAPRPPGLGRWPANVVLDETQAEALDEQSGTLTSGLMRAGTKPKGERETYGQDAAAGYETTRDTPGDSGGASRFFYVAKADASERPRVNGTAHPTVKPLALMRWLVRLVTPPGGTVLEPFAGSGTTVEACIIEGFQCIAIEREADYLPLIRQRIDRRRDPVEALRGQAADLGLFDLLGGEGA